MGSLYFNNYYSCKDESDAFSNHILRTEDNLLTSRPLRI